MDFIFKELGYNGQKRGGNPNFLKQRVFYYNFIELVKFFYYFSSSKILPPKSLRNGVSHLKVVSVCKSVLLENYPSMYTLSMVVNQSGTN